VTAPAGGAKKLWEHRARRVLNSLSRGLKAIGFEVSPVHFNAGGVAVWGEVSFHARRPSSNRSVYVCAYHDMGTPNGEAVLYRVEEWPEHLGGARGHKRTGPNMWLALCFVLPTFVKVLAEFADSQTFE